MLDNWNCFVVWHPVWRSQFKSNSHSEPILKFTLHSNQVCQLIFKGRPHSCFSMACGLKPNLSAVHISTVQQNWCTEAAMFLNGWEMIECQLTLTCYMLLHSCRNDVHSKSCSPITVKEALLKMNVPIVGHISPSPSLFPLTHLKRGEVDFIES